MEELIPLFEILEDYDKSDLTLSTSFSLLYFLLKHTKFKFNVVQSNYFKNIVLGTSYYIKRDQMFMEILNFVILNMPEDSVPIILQSKLFIILSDLLEEQIKCFSINSVFRIIHNLIAKLKKENIKEFLENFFDSGLVSIFIEFLDLDLPRKAKKTICNILTYLNTVDYKIAS